MGNMENWEKLSVVPKKYLKGIQGGTLKGKTDINPQWRIKVMTEVYGDCGTGWKHEKVDRWTQEMASGEIMCFYEVAVTVRNKEGKWSAPIFGIGGNVVVMKTSKGLKANDEGYKMAYTDALGTALKSLGVASEIYEGNFKDSKYDKLDIEKKASRQYLDPNHPSWQTAIEKKAAGMSYNEMNSLFEITEQNWDLLG